MSDEKQVRPSAKPPHEEPYGETLLKLQVELVKFQRHLISKGEKVLIIFEGRDTGGKDGMIKRITEHLSPRDTRVVALGKPSDREASQWYFQRYVPHLPAAGEMVLFNRSWYNRAGVEKVMGFCTDAEYHDFMETVGAFEQMLVRSGIKMFKYYLDIDRHEQKKRLEARKEDPLKQWKLSPIDDVALKHWEDYTVARDEMFQRTSVPVQWRVVVGDDKKKARLNCIRDMLSNLEYHGKKEKLTEPDQTVVFAYNDFYSTRERLAR
jgi:polyphosphate kinase 2